MPKININDTLKKDKSISDINLKDLKTPSKNNLEKKSSILNKAPSNLKESNNILNNSKTKILVNKSDDNINLNKDSKKKLGDFLQPALSSSRLDLMSKNKQNNKNDILTIKTKDINNIKTRSTSPIVGVVKKQNTQIEEYNITKIKQKINNNDLNLKKTPSPRIINQNNKNTASILD